MMHCFHGMEGCTMDEVLHLETPGPAPPERRVLADALGAVAERHALDQVTILFFHGVDQFSERIAAREAPPDAQALGRDRRRPFSHSVPGGSERGAIPACWLGSIRHCPSGPRHNVAEAFTFCPPILMVCVTF